MERELEMVIAILHRAGRRLGRSPAGDDGPQQKQAQCQIESARRELDRMAERIGKDRSNMLSQAQRTAILELSAKGVSKREIARVLKCRG